MAYLGCKYELYDNNGNVIHSEDTRTLKEEKEKLLVILDYLYSEDYLDKVGLSGISKEKAQRKLDHARLGILEDKDQASEIVKKDREIKAEYKARKQAITDAKSCDEAHAACYKHNSV